MTTRPGVPGRAGRLVVAGCLVLATACGAPPPKQAIDAAPLLGWLLRPAGDRCATDGEVRVTADQLAAGGLAAAGYRTIFVVCEGYRAPVPGGADRAALESAGIALEVIGRTDRRIAETLDARDSASALQRAMTRAVIAAGPVIVAGDGRVQLAPQQRAVLTNGEVLSVAVDARRTPGGPVGDSGAVAARAIGDKGIVVSLINVDRQPRRIAFPIAELNLVGSDSVPATDLWTGRRQIAGGGELSAHLPPGGSALLRVGS